MHLTYEVLASSMAFIHACEGCRKEFGIKTGGELVISSEYRSEIATDTSVRDQQSIDGSENISDTHTLSNLDGYLCGTAITLTSRISEEEADDCSEYKIEAKRPRLSVSPTHSQQATPIDPTRNVYCVACLGTLDEAFILNIATSIPSKIQEDGYTGLKSFCIAIHTPLSLMIRRMGMEMYIQKWNGDETYECITQEGYVKEELRNRLKVKLEKSLSLPYEVESPFQIVVKLEHSRSMEECQHLVNMYPDCFKRRNRRGRSNKPHEEDVTIVPVRRALESATVQEFSKRGYLLTPVEQQCSYKIELLHKPLYIGGRYNKYSRFLPQTPWIIDGVRKGESSVQELVCEQLCQLARCTDHTFFASGREDVDVRMLGTGRPFAVELTNPRNVCLAQKDLEKVQESINKSTDLISAQLLTEVSKEETSRLKEGEAEKNKQYCALVWSEKEITAADLACLEEIKELKIAQKTPIRVLHRRSLATREKTVHSMHSELVDSHRFKLYLCTQAGTYIKEFVHSDFGRTQPSLGRLLSGREVDILSLDVTDVQLDWPPDRNSDDNRKS